MYKLTYSSNNSGGSWWLEDSDWIALEEAGWTVIWGGWNPRDNYETPKAVSAQEIIDGKVGRWLGAIAKEAWKDVKSPRKGIEEWEAIVGQDPGELGCTCCGPPHNFSWEDELGNYGHMDHVVRSSWSVSNVF